MDNRQRFEKLFNLIDREGKDSLLSYLDENGYFTAPSSTQYHGAVEGGNLEHSLNVTDLMLRVRETLNADITGESIIIVGLFHDLGKCDYYGMPNYIKSAPLKSGKEPAKPYTTNPARLPIPHQVSSLHILSKFIPLTEDETYAILYHNGLYTSDGYVIKGNETPLLMLLHFADMWASRVVEVNETRLDGGLF